MLFTILQNYFYKHSPPIITVLSLIVGCTMYISTTVSNGFDSIESNIIAKARLPTYQMINASLHKQTEKLDRDPKDIKLADIKFLYNQCNDDFGKIYIKTLPPSEILSAKSTCSALEEMYLDNY